MNAIDAERILTLAATFWPKVWPDNSIAQRDAAQLWSESLDDLSFEEGRTALMLYVKGYAEDDFPPRPADLRRMLAEARCNLPSEDDAWREVIREVKRIGSGLPLYVDGKFYQLTPTFSCPELALAVEAVQWTVLQEKHHESYIIHEFKQAFRRYRDATIKNATINRDTLGVYRAGLAGSVAKSIRIGRPIGYAELGVPSYYMEALHREPDIAIPESVPHGDPEDWAANSARVRAGIAALAAQHRIRPDRRAASGGSVDDAGRTERPASSGVDDPEPGPHLRLVPKSDGETGTVDDSGAEPCD